MGNVLNKEIWIEASVEKVYQCFTDAEAMKTWHGKEVELDPVPGGIYRVVFEDGTVILGEFKEVEEHQHLVYSAKYNDVDSIVEIHFSREKNGTKVQIRQEFKTGQDTSTFNHGWGYFLGILKKKIG